MHVPWHAAPTTDLQRKWFPSVSAPCPWNLFHGYHLVSTHFPQCFLECAFGHDALVPKCRGSPESSLSQVCPMSSLRLQLSEQLLLQVWQWEYFFLPFPFPLSLPLGLVLKLCVRLDVWGLWSWATEFRGSLGHQTSLGTKNIEQGRPQDCAAENAGYAQGINSEDVAALMLIAHISRLWGWQGVSGAQCSEITCQPQAHW